MVARVSLEAEPPEHGGRRPTARILVRSAVMASMRGPGRWSLVVMFALGCGGSDTSGGGGGCGSGETASCEIDADSTVCGDRITVLCLDGGSPEASSQCEEALEESGEAIYCCTSAADEAGDATEATTSATSSATTTTTGTTTSDTSGGTSSGDGGGSDGSGDGGGGGAST